MLTLPRLPPPRIWLLLAGLLPTPLVALPASGAPGAALSGPGAALSGNGNKFVFPPVDEVVLVNGKRVRGHVVWEDESVVVVRKGSRETSYPRAKVESVDSAARKVQAFLNPLRGAPPDVLNALKTAAIQAREDGLVGEEQVAWTFALTLEPDDEDAHLGLGHKRKNGTWLWRDGKRYRTLERLERDHRDWGDAWEFDTTHYHVRTNLTLALAVRSALDLERFYRAFRENFAELHIHEPSLRLEAHLHADGVSYPEATSSNKAYYDPENRRLILNMSGGPERWNLFHEATHQILHTSNDKSGGAVPDWISEGLAEYVAAAANGPVGHTRFEFGKPALHHLRLHARAKSPYDLQRVVRLSSGDFMSSTSPGLKYAQAYTLVSYCLDGAESVHRKLFLEYVRESRSGNGSRKEFYRALGIDEQEFEQGWLAFVTDELSAYERR